MYELERRNPRGTSRRPTNQPGHTPHSVYLVSQFRIVCAPRRAEPALARPSSAAAPAGTQVRRTWRCSREVALWARPAAPRAPTAPPATRRRRTAAAAARAPTPANPHAHVRPQQKCSVVRSVGGATGRQRSKHNSFNLNRRPNSLFSCFVRWLSWGSGGRTRTVPTLHLAPIQPGAVKCRYRYIYVQTRLQMNTWNGS